MPLIVLVGKPSSGKSAVCKIVEKFLKEKLTEQDVKPNIGFEIVSDDLRSSFSRDVYSGDSSAPECEQRGFLRSEVQRKLTRNTTVICDSLNYIKGLRYELFCIAKLVKTTYCVVYCDVGTEDLKIMNSRKSESTVR